MVTLRNKINKLLKLQILNNNTFKVRHHEIVEIFLQHINVH